MANLSVMALSLVKGFVSSIVKPSGSAASKRYLSNARSGKVSGIGFGPVINQPFYDVRNFTEDASITATSRMNVTSFPGKPITEANPAPPKDKISVIFYGDSGGGGAACMADGYQYLQKSLLNISQMFRVRFQLHHLGDAFHAPFGPKTPTQILGLTKALIREARFTYKADRGVIACNTASTTDGPELREFIDVKTPGIEVFAIIKPTAKELYSKGKYVDGRRAGKEKHIAVLSTLATAKSGLYPLELAGLHFEKWGPNCITVVNSNLNEPNAPRVFKGMSPVPRESHEEAELLRQVATNSSPLPVLVVHTYAPPEWVSLIEGKTEGKTDADLDNEVMADMAKFFKQMGNDLPKVGVLGLCCTHYPLVTNQIERSFAIRDGQKEGVGSKLVEHMEIVSQGKIVAERLVLPSIQSAVENGAFIRRPEPIHTEILLRSWTTGLTNSPDPNVNKSSEQSLAVVGKLFNKKGGDLANTICQMVPPYLPV